MQPEEIVAFVKRNAEPLPPAPPYGARFRVAGTLTDGTLLPCIVVESASARIDLAMKRLAETSAAAGGGKEWAGIVRAFVVEGNRINDFDLRELSISPFAIPSARLQEIGGETSMGWTEFSATMSDGNAFRFGTQFHAEFFDMPLGYTARDIVRIVPALRRASARDERVYRERPFFTCYVEGI